MNKRIVWVFICLAFLAALSLIISVFAGSSGLGIHGALNAVWGGGDDTAIGIMWKIRIPRTLSAMILGGALALSGYLLQTFFRNPIAGPFILGVSSGAKLAVAVAMIIAAGGYYTLSSFSMICAAFIGSLISLGFVLIVSRRVGNMAMLVVCGVMIGYICSAITDFIITFASDSDIVNLRSWSMGSFSGMTMDNVTVMTCVVVPAFLAALFLSKPIGIYRLGEGAARNVGVNIRLLRAMLVVLSGLLSACVTAFAGPVSFVGVAAPHIMRTAMKTTKPLVLIPACFMCGSVFCVVSDMIARYVLAPAELSISTVTAIFGAPIVIVIMINRRRGEV